jgi:hypothetical protein
MEDMSNFTSYIKESDKTISIDEEEFETEIEEGKHNKNKK